MDIAKKQVSEAIYWTYPKSTEQKDREMEMYERKKKDKSQLSDRISRNRKIEEIINRKEIIEK